MLAMPAPSTERLDGDTGASAIFRWPGSNELLVPWMVRPAVALSLSGLLLAQEEPRFEAVASFVRPSSRVEQNAWVLLGPQEALYIAWGLVNHTRTVLQLPSPAESIGVRLETTAGRSVPLAVAIEPAMRRLSRPRSVRFDEPIGPVTLDDSEAVSVYAVVERSDHQPFSPGEYRVTFETDGLVAALRQVDGGRWAGRTRSTSTTRLIIDPLDTAASEIKYHHIEAAFHIGHDPDKVLEHRKAVVALPGAQVTDRMALGKAYAALGRHQEAVQVYGPILPESMESARRGSLIRDGRHLRAIASSYLAVGQRDTARRLLEAEGIATPSQIPDLLNRLSRPADGITRRPWHTGQTP